MKHNLKVTHLGEAGLKTVKFIGINGTESDLGIVKRAKRAFGVSAKGSVTNLGSELRFDTKEGVQEQILISFTLTANPEIEKGQ